MRGPSFVCGAIVCALVGTVHAEEPGKPADAPSDRPVTAIPPKPRSFAPSYSHKKQLLVSARIGLGMRAIVPYQKDTYCGDTSTETTTGFAATCTSRAPVALDLELGYGVARQVDLFVELRVGLETDFGKTPTEADGPRPFHLSPGARFFFGETDKVKVFTTAQLVLDLSSYQTRDGTSIGNDFGIRNLSGIWFDLAREYGFYIYAGPTASFARWFRFEFEGGIGVQGRYP